MSSAPKKCLLVSIPQRLGSVVIGGRGPAPAGTYEKFTLSLLHLGPTRPEVRATPGLPALDAKTIQLLVTGVLCPILFNAQGLSEPPQIPFRVPTNHHP